MIRGEDTAIARGVTPQEAFDFVLDPAPYTGPGDHPLPVGGAAPHRRHARARCPAASARLVEIDEVDGGTRIHHVEEMDFGCGPLGWLYDRIGGQWFSDSVDQEVDEIARLLEAGERGHGVDAHDDAGASQPR